MKIQFTKRKNPTFAELRPSYKISQIVLILKISSRSSKSSLERLHLFNWALMGKENRITLIRLSNSKYNELLFWSIDPILNQALSFALAEKLIDQENGKYILTDKGDLYAETIISENVLHDDIEFLQTIGKRINEKMISNIQKMWD